MNAFLTSINVTGETQKGAAKEKDVRMSNIIAAKGTSSLHLILADSTQALT
jgi:hypothetical protein